MRLAMIPVSIELDCELRGMDSTLENTQYNTVWQVYSAGGNFGELPYDIGDNLNIMYGFMF